jgi:arsenate reductase (thioredoxin)
MLSWKETVAARAGAEPPLVLFLGRTNAATSILAEAILRHLAQGRVRAASAGHAAALHVNPYAFECLAAHRIPTTELFSKPWSMFLGYYRPPVRVLITLCDPSIYAARADWDYEAVHTVKGYWPTPDPEATAGKETEMRLDFEVAFVTLEARIRRFLALPLDRLSDEALSHELERIGEVQGDLG